MSRHSATRKRTGMAVSLAATLLTAASVTSAGPGCMKGPSYTNMGGYPHSPMGAYPSYGPPGYRAANPAAAPARGDWRMPAQPQYRSAYGSPMQAPARPQYRNAYGSPAMQAPVQARTTESSGAGTDSKEQAAGDNVTVRIDGMQFKPATIKVKPGTTVTWIHDSSMPHTVSGDADGLRSSTMYKGQKFSYTFNKSGDFSYICDLHPGMKGKVVVESGGQRT